MDRRAFLRGAATSGAIGTTMTMATAGGASGVEGSFQHGVASGDPLADRVVIWTRVTPRPGTTSATVTWIVATDVALTDVVATSTLATNGARGFTVKVDVDGLAAGTTYFFGFEHAGERSRVGRTRTAPSGATDHLRFAVASCQDFQNGFWNAWARIADRADLAAVIHLGDYVYEGYRTDGVRLHEPPHEAVTLADYRTRYAQMRLDPDLQDAHAQHPFICVWDDHETANNSHRDGAGGHQDSEGDWEERKRVAIQAWHEWLPVRPGGPNPAAPDAVATADDQRIHRQLAFGDLVDLFMLDTRLIGRDPELTTGPTGGAGTGIAEPGHADPDRSLLGDDQRAWLYDAMAASNARWRLIGQQVVVTQWNFIAPLPRLPGDPEGEFVRPSGNTSNPDQWDGYLAERDRLFDEIDALGDGNVVVLTGDVHSSWGNDLTRDPVNPAVYDPVTRRGVLAVEFVAPAISSAAFDGLFFNETGANTVRTLTLAGNPSIQYLEVLEHGYVVLDITHERVQGEWWYVPIDARSSEERFGHARFSEHGTPALIEATEPSAAAEPAPTAPRVDLPVPGLFDESATPQTGGGIILAGAAVLGAAWLRRRGATGSVPTDAELRLGT